MHDVAARSLLVLLFASLSAGATLLGTHLLGLVAGFVAVALVIDFIFPVTGFLRIDAEHAFQRLAWQRRREGLAQRSWGRDRRRLELLPSGQPHAQWPQGSPAVENISPRPLSSSGQGEQRFTLKTTGSNYLSSGI
jgi:hypothetical protein